ncbi:Uncharacterised protein [Mycobacteroides abscessus]|nr:Uncharacterised protein [Mycobacteroides abscessus]
MHDATNFSRLSGVAAAFEKNLDQVQPPSDMRTLVSGCSSLSLRSWLKFPASAWPGASATPSTESSAETARTKSACASPAPSLPPGSGVPGASARKHVRSVGWMLPNA